MYGQGITKTIFKNIIKIPIIPFGLGFKDKDTFIIVSHKVLPQSHVARVLDL